VPTTPALSIVWPPAPVLGLLFLDSPQIHQQRSIRAARYPGRVVATSPGQLSGSRSPAVSSREERRRDPWASSLTAAALSPASCSGGVAAHSLGRVLPSADLPGVSSDDLSRATSPSLKEATGGATFVHGARRRGRTMHLRCERTVLAAAHGRAAVHRLLARRCPIPGDAGAAT
jgi:hypothetical protein